MPSYTKRRTIPVPSCLYEAIGIGGAFAFAKNGQKRSGRDWGIGAWTTKNLLRSKVQIACCDEFCCINKMGMTNNLVAINL